MIPCARRAGLVGVGLLLVASCADPDSGAADTPGSIRHTIEVRDMAFQPAELRVHPGDTVVWVNRDVVPHNVADLPEWESPAVAQGERWELVVEDVAVVDYICAFHPVMEGRLIVEQQPTRGGHR